MCVILDKKELKFRESKNKDINKKNKSLAKQEKKRKGNENFG